MRQTICTDACRVLFTRIRFDVDNVNKNVENVFHEHKETLGFLLKSRRWQPPPVTRQAVTNWRVRYDDFARPAETLQHGSVWDAEVVKAWLDAHSGRGTIVISVINLKGGVAKTTTSVAIAEVLAKTFRKHVLFIDLDPQTNATINLIGED